MTEHARGSDIANVIPLDRGPHAGELRCAQCGAFRGWVPQQAFDFYKKVSAFWGVLIEFVLRDEDLKRRRLLADEWRWSVARLAKQTIALPAAWTQEFGEEWKRFGTSDLVTYARQAAATWARIAADLDPTAIPDFLARRGAA